MDESKETKGRNKIELKTSNSAASIIGLFFIEKSSSKVDIGFKTPISPKMSKIS